MIKFHLEVPVIGILRGIEQNFFGSVMEESFAAGLQAIEITLNTNNSLNILSANRTRVTDGKLLGMGTICHLDEARQAIEAGAMFLVTPNFNPEVIRYAVSHKIPVISGALTPTEIFNAWKGGAAMIKVFPCGAMGGPQYIKELRGPFDSIPLAAVGGVTLQNLKNYFQAGAQAVGVSTSLFGKEALQKKSLADLSKNVRNFIDCATNITSTP